MKKSFILLIVTLPLFLNAQSSNRDVRLGLFYSANFPYNKFGVGGIYSDKKIAILLNYNTGTEGILYSTKPNSGVYAIGPTWENYVIGEKSSCQVDRDIISVSSGPCIFQKEGRDLRIRAYAVGGIGVYDYVCTKDKYYVVRDYLGVFDDYLILKNRTVEKLRPVIFNFGIVTQVNFITFGAGFNTPPINSGAPVRLNLMVGFNTFF